ncbi:hypothetical protein BX600DRAFT_436111 [Xylariales sp. PMI_506]|nr:hypothetical protein BX600DRAFT_436111 [Xylariales sp. PMI_506]
MTKPWETYEATIKGLYQQHTLATVKQIMQDRHNFRASTRAYRQRLDAWGCTKYKKRDKPSLPKSHGETSNNPGTSQPHGSSPVAPQQEVYNSWFPSSNQVQGVTSGAAYPNAAAWAAPDNESYMLSDQQNMQAASNESSHGSVPNVILQQDYQFHNPSTSTTYWGGYDTIDEPTHNMVYTDATGQPAMYRTAFDPLTAGFETMGSPRSSNSFSTGGSPDHHHRQHQGHWRLNEDDDSDGTEGAAGH